jgi:hypothetical protein
MDVRKVEQPIAACQRHSDNDETESPSQHASGIGKRHSSGRAVACSLSGGPLPKQANSLSDDGKAWLVGHGCCCTIQTREVAPCERS